MVYCKMFLSATKLGWTIECLFIFVCLNILLVKTTLGQNGGLGRATARQNVKCNDNKSETKVFCEEVESYPENELEAIIKRNRIRYEKLFGVDPIRVENRFDPAGTKSFCEHREHVIYPRSGTNRQKIKRVIVNTDEFRQGVRVEECLNEGRECELNRSFPIEYKSECRQNYIYRPLLAKSDKNLEVDHFLFPSSCKCFLVR